MGPVPGSVAVDRRTGHRLQQMMCDVGHLAWAARVSQRTCPYSDCGERYQEATAGLGAHGPPQAAPRELKGQHLGEVGAQLGVTPIRYGSEPDAGHGPTCPDCGAGMGQVRNETAVDQNTGQQLCQFSCSNGHFHWLGKVHHRTCPFCRRSWAEPVLGPGKHGIPTEAPEWVAGESMRDVSGQLGLNAIRYGDL